MLVIKIILGIIISIAIAVAIMILYLFVNSDKIFETLDFEKGLSDDEML